MQWKYAIELKKCSIFTQGCHTYCLMYSAYVVSFVNSQLVTCGTEKLLKACVSSHVSITKWNNISERKGNISCYWFNYLCNTWCVCVNNHISWQSPLLTRYLLCRCVIMAATSFTCKAICILFTCLSSVLFRSCLSCVHANYCCPPRHHDCHR